MDCGYCCDEGEVYEGKAQADEKGASLVGPFLASTATDADGASIPRQQVGALELVTDYPTFAKNEYRK